MKYIRQQTILNKLKSETQHLTVRNWSGGSEFIQPGLVGFCTREKLQEFSVEAVQHVPKKLVSVLHRVRIFRERFNCISGGMRLNIGLYLLLITSKPWHNFPNSLKVKLDQYNMWAQIWSKWNWTSTWNKLSGEMALLSSPWFSATNTWIHHKEKDFRWQL